MASPKTITALTLIIAASLCGQSLTQSERSKAVAELERTRDLLLSATANLSEDKARIKPGPNRWSVLDCVEHLAVTEGTIFGMLQGNLKAPPSSEEMRAKTAGKTAMMAKFLTDRNTKVQAPAEIAPTGRFKTLAEAREAFSAARDKTIAFTEKTEDDLHAHVVKHLAFGELDLYQWLLLMAGHSERHTLQAEEAKGIAMQAKADPLEGLWKGYDGEWGHVSRQLLALAEAIPAEKFSWRPSPDTRSTSEVVMHLASTNFSLLSITGPKPPADFPAAPEKAVTNKADVIAWLKRSLEAVKVAQAGVSAEDLRRKVRVAGRDADVDGIYLRIIVHANQHMGELIAYARTNGIAPPWSAGNGR